MTVKKSLTALAMIGFMMGAINFEGKTMIKEEEILETKPAMSLQNYTYQIMDEITAFGFTDKDFYGMKKTVQNYQFEQTSVLVLNSLLDSLVDASYNAKNAKCSEETFNYIVLFSKVLKSKAEEIDEKTTSFSVMLLKFLMRRYIYHV
ncbi:hypothetical protein Cva_01716 [Caedimonas varicaedens]|uniref:Uncharacterized protein n=1 Tax=Caedimonas varicaedens TaxID=1629334 RepID=A0A0K8MFR8_9PROT|nr:hypothetical protein Cva_01716 [Caedimonas varicaedens]